MAYQGSSVYSSQTDAGPGRLNRSCQTDAVAGRQEHGGYIHTNGRNVEKEAAGKQFFHFFQSWTLDTFFKDLFQ